MALTLQRVPDRLLRLAALVVPAAWCIKVALKVSNFDLKLLSNDTLEGTLLKKVALVPQLLSLSANASCRLAVSTRVPNLHPHENQVQFCLADLQCGTADHNDIRKHHFCFRMQNFCTTFRKPHEDWFAVFVFFALHYRLQGLHHLFPQFLISLPFFSNSKLHSFIELLSSKRWHRSTTLNPPLRCYAPTSPHHRPLPHLPASLHLLFFIQFIISHLLRRRTKHS